MLPWESSHRMGFLNNTSIDIWNWIILCCRVSLMHCSVFYSTLASTYLTPLPLETHPTYPVVTIEHVTRQTLSHVHCRTKPPPVKNIFSEQCQEHQYHQKIRTSNSITPSRPTERKSGSEEGSAAIWFRSPPIIPMSIHLKQVWPLKFLKNIVHYAKKNFE